MHLSAASNLLDLSVALQPLSLSDLHHRICHDTSLAEDVQRLRRVRQMDEATYKRLKTHLPFFCCASFRDGLRRSGQFIAADAFVLDMDGVGEASVLLERIGAADARLALGFVSPGGNGVKLLFRLATPCTSTKAFSDFYKAFALDFAARHGVQQWLDTRTSDATRACFLSHDPQALYRPDAELVDWAEWLPENTQPVLAGMSHDGSVPLTAAPEVLEGEPSDIVPNRSHQIRPDVYSGILERLKARATPTVAARSVFVPDVLEQVQPAIERALMEEGIRLVEAKAIQYGKQLVMQHVNDVAEVNIFYGKRGFSAVKVPKRHTHEALAEVCVQVIEQVFYQRTTWEGAGE